MADTEREAQGGLRVDDLLRREFETDYKRI